MEQNTIEEGKTIAIISYITVIGLIIAFIMNGSKKNAFAKFHIQQSIGLVVVSLVNSFVIGMFSAIAAQVIGVIILVFMILGIVAAVKGEDKPLPLLGEQFQEWFKNI